MKKNLLICLLSFCSIVFTGCQITDIDEYLKKGEYQKAYDECKKEEGLYEVLEETEYEYILKNIKSKKEEILEESEWASFLKEYFIGLDSGHIPYSGDKKIYKLIKKRYEIFDIPIDYTLLIDDKYIFVRKIGKSGEAYYFMDAVDMLVATAAARGGGGEVVINMGIEALNKSFYKHYVLSLLSQTDITQISEAMSYLNDYVFLGKSTVSDSAITNLNNLIKSNDGYIKNIEIITNR